MTDDAPAPPGLSCGTVAMIRPASTFADLRRCATSATFGRNITQPNEYEMTRAKAFLVTPLILLGLAACEPVPPSGGTGGVTVPESVSSIAAPFQDLTTARIRAEDGCYWYTHRGPVETTELPLRTAGGNPICVRPQS